MRSLIIILAITGLIFTGCKKDDTEDPNTLSGSSNITLNTANNSSTVTIQTGGVYIDVGGTVTVKKCENDITTLSIKADLTKDPKLAKLNSIIPASMKDNSGKVNTDVNFKITSEGIQDFVMKDKPQTIIKYDAKVGDKYVATRSDGATITRTVTLKSDQNDFQWGFYNIKTNITEEGPSPGIKKIIYRTNHKFGLVYVEMTLEDNTILSTYLFPKYTD